MYNNDILKTLTGNQPDLKKLIEQQANQESGEHLDPNSCSTFASGKRGSVKKLTKRHNSVKRHK